MDIILCILCFCIGFIIGWLICIKESDNNNNSNNNKSSNYDYNALCDGDG